MMKTLLASLGALLLLCSCSQQSEQSRVVKIGLTHGNSHSFTQALTVFGELLEERTDGRYTVKIFSSSQVGSEKEMQEMLTIGSLDMSLTGIINQYQPMFALFEMPYLYRDREHVISVNTSPLMQELGASLNPYGIHLFGFYENGYRNISNSIRPIETPADLEGLLIRTPENPAQIETIEALGAIPTPLSFSELYTALIQGVVDGQENPLQNIWFGRLHEAQDHIAITRHIYNSVYVIMSMRLWETVSEADRVIFTECMLESSIWQMNLVGDMEQELEQQMKDYGVQFTYPDLEPFKTASQPAYEALYEQLGPEAREIVRRIGAL